MSPDALFLDDVRNPAEALACLEAAAAGIMVVAQMRAVDNVHALRRFVEFGVSSQQLTEYLVALINRRSVRGLCAACRATCKPGESAAAALGLAADAEVWHAPGCDSCHDGFAGRRTVYDIWPAGHRLGELLRAEELPVGDLLAWGRSQPLGLLAALKSAVCAGEIDPDDAAPLV
jgi:type II secretory ATPase GspE/PulE/Tfp pilus assembly ATPase PilB-like protein